MMFYPICAAHVEKQPSSELYSKGGGMKDEENRNSI